jgi:hypothetical protein
MKEAIIVYQVDAVYSNGNDGFSYSFYFMTPEPISTQFGRIINLICQEQNVPYADLSRNYFDVSVIKISKV